MEESGSGNVLVPEEPNEESSNEPNKDLLRNETSMNENLLRNNVSDCSAVTSEAQNTDIGTD